MKITDNRHAQRVSQSSLAVARTAGDVSRAKADRDAALALSRGTALGPVPTDQAQVRQGTLQRLGSSSSVNLSLQKPRDPEFWWRRNNDFYDIENDRGLEDLRRLCHRLYTSHPLIGSAVDIFSKWPVVGAEFRCKDEKLTEFYSDLFFDTLNYEEFLVDIGREHWTVGEALPLGTWNSTLGVWSADELIHPRDVRITKSPFLREPVMEMRLPAEILRIISTRQPPEQYNALISQYPDLVEFATHSQMLPVSNHLLKQIKFKGSTFHPRGIPIMSRGIRAVLQEEMLNSAQDSVADRLATPFILARIGASASDLGTQQPWVPTPDQIADFEGMFDAALAADFRMMTTHFAVNVDNVFGREAMPNFDPDFERLGERILQVWGLSKTMLSGASGGQTYAADAINRDLITQLSNTYQRQLKRFVRERMLVVAEAQGHYDYETRGSKRYPIMEEVLEVLPDGTQRIVEQPKLLVPDLHLKPMTMADEKAEEEFFAASEAAGYPISMRTRFANRPVDFDDEIEQTREEQVRRVVEEQKTRKAAYQALADEGLPIPEDLRKDFEPRVDQPPAGTAALDTGSPPPPMLGEDTAVTPMLTPNAEVAPVAQEPGAAAGPVPLPTNQFAPPPQGRTRPPESDEQRANMPKPASVVIPLTNHVTGKVENVTFEGDSLVAGPSHIGMSRHLGLSADQPLED